MIYRFQTCEPVVENAAFVAPGAVVVGDVILGRDASVWFGSIVRGDVCHIRIGALSNIQDLTMIHVTRGTHPTVIGERVTVGHRAVLHGCTVESSSLIGMGAIILDGAVVEEGAIVGAGALVPPGARVARGTVVMGAPARVVRHVTAEEREEIVSSAERYAALARTYATAQREVQTSHED